MTQRADYTEVIAINKSTLDECSIDAFICAASVIIDGVAADCPELGGQRLRQAEVWLAAHMMALTTVGQDDGVTPIKREKFEGYDIELAVSSGTGSGIMSTKYGEMANTLTGGCLADQDKQNGGVFFAGGSC